MKSFRFLNFVPALLFIISACRIGDSPTDVGSNPVEIITTTLVGVVNDEAGKPLSDVIVKANGNTAYTDNFGTFMLPNVRVPANRCFIICTKRGYFTGSRAEIPIAGGLTELRLSMQSNVANFSVNSKTGGTVTVGGASVKFPPSAFVTSTGTPYTGTVNAAVKILDPTQNSFYNSFSGDMTAIRNDGSQTELLSYGVLRVHITDKSGNKLSLAVGKTATLTYPIAPLLQKNAPQSMPLWYFDVTNGLWKEEGAVTKSGAFYTGEVAHFTDWNCDLPAQTGTIRGRVLCDNEAVEGVYVTVGQRKVFTDTGGFFSCRVPINNDVIISVNPSENGGLTATAENVSALTRGETRSVNVQLTACPASVSGVITDCDGNPIAGSVVVPVAESYVFHFTTSGEFKMHVPSGVDLSVQATTIDGKLSLGQSVGKLNPSEKKDIGRLSACDYGSSSEFYDLPGGDVIFGTELSADGMMIAISGAAISPSNKHFVAVYDTKTSTRLSIFYAQENKISAINFSDDGTKLLLHWEGDSACVVNPQTGLIIRSFPNATQLRMLPDGSAVIAISNYFAPFGLTMYSVVDGFKIKDLSFNEIEEYSLAGTLGSSQIILHSIYDPSIGTKIIHWDIATDTKSNEITIPNITLVNTYSYGYEFSPDFSAVVSGDKSRYGLINFYNTKTGAKLNTSPFLYPDTISQRGIGDIALSNDLTFVVQGIEANGKMLPPSTYYVKSGKLQKVLAMHTQNSVYESFSYCASSRYVAGILHNPPGIPFSAEYSVRVWKVK